MTESSTLAKFDAEADQALQGVALLPITTHEEYQQAAEVLVEVKRTIRAIEDERKKITQPLNAALKSTNGFFKKVSTKYERAEEILKQKAGAYLEAERTREAKLLAEFASSEESHARESLVLAASAAPVAQGVSARTTKSWEVENLDEVPDAFWQLNDSLIGVAIRSGQQIPGIRVVEKTSLAVSCD
jgi:hypothetical protein